MSDKMGVVQTISKSAKGFFSLLLDDGEWYGYAMQEPKDSKGRSVAAGDTARFTYSINGTFKKINEGSMKIKAAPPGTVAPVTDYDRQQQRICMAGCVNTAVQLITHAHTTGMFKFTGKQQYAAFMAVIQEESEYLYKMIQNTPDHHSDLVKVESEKKEELPEGLDMPDPHGTGQLHSIKGEEWDE